MGDPQAEITGLQKRIASRTMMIFLPLAVAMLFLGWRAPAKGLVLGSVFSLLNFILMGIWLPFMLGKSRARARFAGLVSILFRYLILAVPLIIAAKTPSFSFIAVVVGLFAVPMVTLGEHLIFRDPANK